MRVPTFRHFRHWAQHAGLFIAGMVVGAAVFMAAHQNVINFALEKERLLDLQMQLIMKNIESRAQHEKKPLTINAISVHFEYGQKQDLPDLTRAELKLRIRNDLDVLLGKNINDITPPIDNGTKVLKTLYERLHTNVNGKDYLARINSYVVIYGELRVWVELEPFQRLIE